MTRSHFVAATLAAVAVATNSVAAALPGYLGAFGTARDALVNPEMVFLYTFDQHECSTNPTFENKITTDFGTHTVSDLTLVAGSTVNPTCLTGSAGSGFANTPVEPGFNQTNSGALQGGADSLTTEIFDAGIVSVFSTLEMWITIDVLTFSTGEFTTILKIGENLVDIGVFDVGNGEVGMGFRSQSHAEAQTQDRDGLVHVVFVNDHVSVQNKIYVNGTNVSLGGFSNSRNTKLPLATFVKVPILDTAVVTMHSVALYDRELTPAEISELYSAGIPPSLPVFPGTLVIEGTEGIDVSITATTLLGQTSDPSGTLSGVEIISKRATDLLPANTPSLPAVGAAFTVTAEPGRSTYDPTAPANEVCGTTTDSEYVIYQISTVPTGCEDSAGSNLCSVSTNLKVCLSFVDSPATWESENVDVTDAAFDMWTPLTGLVPNDDDGEDLTLLVSGNPTFDIGYTEDANDCTGNIVTIAKNSAPATTLTALALGKPICYKSSKAFPASLEVGTITLAETGPSASTEAQFSVAVEFPYALTSSNSSVFQEDDTAMLLTFIASDSRNTLTNGYKFKITSLPTSASSEYFISSSSDRTITAAKISIGDTLAATRQGASPEFDLYLHANPNYSVSAALSVGVVVSNGDEVIPDAEAFSCAFTVEEVPDLVVFSNNVGTTSVHLHQFSSISGMSVLDVDPVPRNLNVSIWVENGAVKYSGGDIIAPASGCGGASMSVECSACMFSDAGCDVVDLVDTSVVLQSLFDGLVLRNDDLGSVYVLVTLMDIINEGELNETLYEETFNVTVAGFASPTTSPTAPTLSPSHSPTVTRAPSSSPSQSPSTASPTGESTAGLGMGLLIGVTVGPLFALGALAVGLIFLARRRRDAGEPKTALVASLSPSDIESDNKYNGRSAAAAAAAAATSATPPRAAKKHKSHEKPAEDESEKQYKPRRPSGPRPTTFKTSKKDYLATNTSVFDWEKHVEKGTGDVYFFNPASGETQWEPPSVEVKRGGGK